MPITGGFTTAEVAEIADLAVISVVWNIKHGRLKATKQGRVWIIQPDDLEVWLKAREQAGQPRSAWYRQ